MKSKAVEMTINTEEKCNAKWGTGWGHEVTNTVWKHSRNQRRLGDLEMEISVQFCLL